MEFDLGDVPHLDLVGVVNNILVVTEFVFVHHFDHWTHRHHRISVVKYLCVLWVWGKFSAALDTVLTLGKFVGIDISM